MSATSHTTRSARRAQIELTGQVKLGTFSSVGCTVTDLSLSGAQLILDRPIKKLPKRFSVTVHANNSSKKHKCTCRWQEGQSLGVEFLYD